MPYSESDHSRFVAGLLASASMCSIYSVLPFSMLYPNMPIPHADLHGKTAMVTGANSGIGYECARALASMGARVVLLCRNQARGEEAVHAIIQNTGSDKVELEIVDFASMETVKAFVERWGKQGVKTVDILINNAGGLSATLKLTPDGFEETYQINHLSHVLLTFSLLNRGYMAPDARIISVSSVSAFESDILGFPNADNQDILSKHNTRLEKRLSLSEAGILYGRSKASQAVWTMVLQRYLAQTERWRGITVQACHPGFIDTPIWIRPDGLAGTNTAATRLVVAVGKTMSVPLEQGAAVPLWLATAKEPTVPEARGMFWSRMRRNWLWPWMLEKERQGILWDKWCKDVQISLTI